MCFLWGNLNQELGYFLCQHLVTLHVMSWATFYLNI